MEAAMRARRRLVPLTLLLALGALACALPKRGTPVFVDANAGNFWTGEGVLLEVSPDQQRCKVAVRDRALIVRTLWVECKRIHPKRG
jgi:hypothetical protein